MSKISCFFPHPYPHPLPVFQRGEDLNSALPGSLSQWVRLPQKSNAKKTPHHPKGSRLPAWSLWGFVSFL